MVRVLEKLLSHTRAIELLRLSSSVVRDHCLRYNIEDADKACDEIAKVADKLTATYVKLRHNLENPEGIEEVLSIPAISGKSLEELNQLKTELSRSVSSIDKQIAQVKSESK